MEVFNIDVRVGFGAPEDGDIIFHVHFTRPEGLLWVATYSYGQFCSLDNYVNYNCEKIKHVVFPILSRHRIKTLMKILSSEEFNIESTKDLIRLKDMIEMWLHVILLRLQAMPIPVHNRIEKFLFLPQGPSNGHEDTAAISIPGVIEQVPNSKKKEKGMFGYKKKTEDDVDDGYEQLVQAEAEAENRLPPLLKVNVRRGREGKYGKLEYEIQVFYSKDSRDHPHCVFRRYSEFAALYNSLKAIEGDKYLFTTFPMPPAKCSLGLSLDESELSIRTRQLDAWFRDCFYQFPRFKSQSKALVRDFLQLVVHSAEEVVEPSSPLRYGNPGGSMSMVSNPYDSQTDRAMRIVMEIQKGLSLGLVEGSRAVLFEFPQSHSSTTRTSAISHHTSSSNNNKSASSSNNQSAARKGPPPAGGVGKGGGAHPAREDDDDDASVLSGDSRVSGSSMLSHNAKIKKKRRNLINSMWETMSSMSKTSGGKEKDDPTTSSSANAGAATAAAAVPSRPRMTKYIVLNAVVSGSQPILRWDPNLGGVGGGAGGGSGGGMLGTVEEGESESMGGILSTQSIGALVGVTGTNGGDVPINGTAGVVVDGTAISAADLCNRLAAHQQHQLQGGGRSKAFNERQAAVIKYAPYNKRLLAMLAESAGGDNDG